MSAERLSVNRINWLSACSVYNAKFIKSVGIRLYELQSFVASKGEQII